MNRNGKFSWLMQRTTAILLIPLTYFLLKFLHIALNQNYIEMQKWLDMTSNQMGLVCWFSVVCYHTFLGLRVIWEDYGKH